MSNIKVQIDEKIILNISLELRKSGISDIKDELARTITYMLEISEDKPTIVSTMLNSMLVELNRLGE